MKQVNMVMQLPSLDPTGLVSFMHCVWMEAKACSIGQKLVV